jgi:hypothetical protein
VIGSRPGCDIFLPYSGVAQRHARISMDNGVLRVEDLGSRKGLMVDGRRVKEAELQVLDEVKLGGSPCWWRTWRRSRRARARRMTRPRPPPARSS